MLFWEGQNQTGYNQNGHCFICHIGYCVADFTLDLFAGILGNSVMLINRKPSVNVVK